MIRMFSPFIPKEAGDRVKEVIDSGWINTGEKEEELRKKLSKKFNFEYCVATNSCTSALRLSLAVAGVKPFDEVITTPWTMEATNTAILEQFAKPVFADINYHDLNMEQESMEELITRDTKAIVVVHYAGYPCELDYIYDIAFENNLVVIEDAAQALGSKYKGDYIGERGYFVCFSLQTVKIITSGDGGIISTKSPLRYSELRDRIWFGVNKTERINSDIGSFPEDITMLGFKYNMNDMTASMGLAGLKYFDEVSARRLEIGEIYNTELSRLSNVELLHYDTCNTPNYWVYPIHVKNRNKFAKHMRNNGIEVSKLYTRNDKWSIFGPLRDLRNMEKVEEDIIHIPIHQDLTDDEVNHIVRTVKRWK